MVVKLNLVCLKLLALIVIYVDAHSAGKQQMFVSKEQKPDVIQWSNDLAWQKIKAKAKKENKYIFVDAYATWCSPCKDMERKTFCNDTIGRYINEKFISVRVQFDTTEKDNEQVKDWYSTAAIFLKRYNISVFPTYLFFDTSGAIVHKGSGFKSVSEFISVLNDAIDPEKQFYVRLNHYKSGSLLREQYPLLSQAAKNTGEKEIETEVFRKFIDKYANLVVGPAYLTREEWIFISNYSKLINSRDRVFEWCLNRNEVVDSLAGKLIAKRLTDVVINNEEVIAIVEKHEQKGMTPRWKSIEKSIVKKYGRENLNSKVISAKLRWYKKLGKWSMYTKYLVDLVENGDVSKVPTTWQGSFYLNSNAWEIFVRSDPKSNKKQIETALKWVEKAITIDSILKEEWLIINHSDTKANLLYKLGKVEDAICLEKSVVKRFLDLNVNRSNNEFQNNLEKMMKGLPTWPDNFSSLTTNPTR